MALKRLTAEFGMGSGLVASPKATRPAKNSFVGPSSRARPCDANIVETGAARKGQRMKQNWFWSFRTASLTNCLFDNLSGDAFGTSWTLLGPLALPFDPVRFLIPSTIKPNGRLVPVSSTRCRAYTPGLSTWSSSTALQGDLVLRLVSRLDAFSGYPFRT